MLIRKAFAKSGRRRSQLYPAIALCSTAVAACHVAVSNDVSERHMHAFPKFFRRSAAAPGDQSTTAASKRKVSIHAARGPRAAMEDRWFVSDDLKFFAVYDGHGGHRVAEQAQKSLYEEFVKQLEEIVPPVDETTIPSDEDKTDDSQKKSTAARTMEEPKYIEQALAKSFDVVSRKILSTTYLDLEGSTAVVVYVGDENLISANIGDSRAILCRGPKAIPLTIDHKPDSTRERKRIEDLGGRVKWHGYLGPDRLPVPGMGAYRINGNLAVSRALGDRLERPYVSSEPDIVTHTRNADEDRFIVLASDGLWDVMTSQEVVDFVKQIMAGSMGPNASGRQKNANNSPFPSNAASSAKKKDGIRSEIDKRQENMAQFIVEEALRRGSADNVTAIVIWLR